MPRKFLGNRIDANLDFVRPASLGVTSFDLNNLPDLPGWSSKEAHATEDTKIIGNNGRRISRAFGGTVKLKNRLSSVPELLIRRTERLAQKNSEVQEHDSLSQTPLPKKKDIPVEALQQINPVLRQQASKDVRSSGSKFTKPAVMNRASRSHVPSPLASPPIVSNRTNVMAFPAITNTATNTGFSLSRNKSIGEALFDEILTAYGSLPENQKPKGRTTIFRKNYEHPINQQLKATFPTLENKNRAHFDPVIRVDDYSDEHVRAVSDNTELATAMGDTLPSPYYFNSSGSDPSSSGEEFSDIGSIMSSLKSPRSDESATYFSADDHLSSPTKVSVATSTKTQQEQQQLMPSCSLRHVRTCQVHPRIFTPDDSSEDSGASDYDSEDNGEPHIAHLQDELIDLDIGDTSSSIYHD
ncbi:Dse3p LALA0_S01e04610g [Lachancea lanzarotensis]|uniref:LALA0S01e04610g1_1 n=1 Tax=Lachancea lanzarotensis TaxID=1245769 RepID=A0A0C7N3W4_9SACH|nr:uncharacterized protein LALA0_S01e04610g [Lachancea lanzarotensis]CEP60171.1 LALA0S01e04610g1_1 [Lachancea lanzarotensis]